jgi:outer membrane protein TolC
MDPPRPHLLTLHDCVTMALQESPAMEASRFDVASAAAEIRAERGKYLPQITGNATGQLFSGSPTNKFSIVNLGENGGIIGVNGNRTGNGRAVDLGEVELYSGQFKYPLFKDGSILGLNDSPPVAIAEANRRRLAWTTALTRAQVVDRITDAYLTTVSAENRSGYADRRVKLLDLEVRITHEQQKQGLSLPIDLHVAEVQYQGAVSLAKLLHDEAVSGSIELSRALGLDSPDALHLDHTLPEPPDPPNAETLLGNSLNQHPTLQVQRAVIDKAKASYELERYRLYPSVNLDGTALHIDDFGSASANVYEGAVTVDVPIFDFGAQLSLTRSKLLAYKAERARLLEKADDVTFEIVKTYQEIYVLTQNILSLRTDVSKAERDMQVTSSQQQQGISPPLTAIEKELHLIAKRDDLDGLEVRRLILYAALQQAAGGSWEWVK